MPYALGPVRPHVRRAAEHVGSGFSVSTIYGVASRSGQSDHPLGLALDFMVYGDKAKGDAIAQYVQANAAALGVTYVIWYQKIWSTQRSGEGWRPMADRGSATANHLDHVHVSFSANVSSTVAAGDFGPGIIPPISPAWPWKGDGDALPDAPNIPNPLDEIKAVLSWLKDGHNWLRIGFIVGGLALVFLALIKMGANVTGVIPKRGK